MATLSFSVRGKPELDRALERFTGRQQKNRLRRAVRAGAKPMQAALKAAAATEPTGNLPASFQKVPAAKVSTHGGESGSEIVARVKPKSPLFNIFEPGAGAHEIEAGASGILAGPEGGGRWTPGGRKRPGAFFARGRVRHPGMRARPILPTAFAAGKGAAEDALARVLFEPG